jgi:hypothetical protein
LDRPANTGPDGKMYIVNHFLDVEILPDVLVPDKAAAGTTNSAADIEKQMSLCEGIYGRPPNVVLVDWCDEGQVFSAQDQSNGVTTTTV